MATRDQIEFECPRCLTHVSTKSENSGKRIDCPNCQFSLLVPSQSLGHNLFEDIFDSLPPAAIAKAENQPGTKSPDSASAISKPDPKKNQAEKNDDLAEIEATLNQPVRKSGDPKVIPQNPTSPSQSDPLLGMELKAATPNPINPPDPFVVNPDATLKIEGLESFYSNDDVFGIKCKVCDTRIHVTPRQVGTEIECPICYSKVTVSTPEQSPKSEQRWLKPQPESSHIRDKDELRLNDASELPKIDYNVDSAFGLNPVSEDLLAPIQKPGPGDALLDLEVIDEDSRANRRAASSGVPPALPGKKDRSRRELYEESQQRQTAAKNSKPRLKTPEAGPATDAVSADSFPDFDFGSLNSAAFVMIRSPGLIWRAAVSGALLGIGSAIMHGVAGSYKEETATMGEWILNTAIWSTLGGLPYLIGTVFLWFICGFVFRDAALGKRQILSWGSAGSTELSSTFWIFGFSFLVAGLPVPPLSFLFWLVMPLRLIFSPPLLLGAWFNKSPFAIVAVDAFQTVARDSSQWKSFYRYVLSLVGLSLIAGLLMMVSTYLLSAICSPLGAALMVPITLAFAAAAGWHCGRVIEGLEKAV